MSKPLWLKSRLGVRSSIPCPDSTPLSTTVKGVDPCRPTALSGNGWALCVTDESPRKVLSGVDVAEENVLKKTRYQSIETVDGNVNECYCVTFFKYVRSFWAFLDPLLPLSAMCPHLDDPPTCTYAEPYPPLKKKNITAQQTS